MTIVEAEIADLHDLRPREGVHTTERVSLRRVGVEERKRIGACERHDLGLGALVAALDACRNSCGAIFDAILGGTSLRGTLGGVDRESTVVQ